jgi:imidazolonepropionase-like amidohydrolase
MKRLKGIKAACHAYDGPGLHYCIDAGVASIEHGIQLDDDAIRKMVAKGTYLVPTLSVYCCALEKADLAMSGGKTSTSSRTSLPWTGIRWKISSDWSTFNS